MESLHCELFLAAASKRFPFSSKALSTLRLLGKPPSSSDPSYPSSQIESALEAISSFACNLTGDYHAEDSPYQTAINIKKGWSSSIYPWVKFFLEGLVLSEDPRTVMGLDLRDIFLHVLPLMLMYPETLDDITAESRRLRGVSPSFSFLMTRAWLYVVDTVHFPWCPWSALLTMILFPDDKDLEEFIGAMDKLNSSGTKNVASICIRLLNHHARHAHKMDNLELRGVHGCLLLLCGCFHTASPLYYPLVINGAVTALVNLLTAFIARQKTLARFDVNSPEFTTAISIIDLIIFHIETCLSGQLWVAEALDAGIITSFFKAERLFDFDESGRSQREHGQRSCWKFGRLIQRIGLYFVYPGVLHRFLHSVKRVEQSGLEENLDPRPKCFLQMWAVYKRRADEVHGLCITLQEARRITCKYDECDSKLQILEDNDSEQEKLRYLRCSACKNAVYCSAGCARKHWKARHHKECHLLAQAFKEGRPFPTTLDLHFIQCLLECFIANHQHKIRQDIEAFVHSSQSSCKDSSLVCDCDSGFDPHKRPIALVDFDDVDNPDPMSEHRLSIVDLETAVAHDRVDQDQIQPLLNGIHNAKEDQLVVILFVPGSAGRPEHSWSIVDILNLPRAYETDEECSESSDDDEES
ncbi:hypothetical protein Moror_15028 [Moniliophthora roreri MCA 2997]|uniref:MYND-type domain-containing protein n=2 Tax=Moniliophthora roreri TaxID=221103 RepID=V2WSW5_MONRO|nr:hypothetical protein Moror_15028 [Moniliophthora roreri MCA 2997]KAI3605429.1 hypothetical protein WG66_005989 [Moniliophthora roreri]